MTTIFFLFNLAAGAKPGLVTLVDSYLSDHKEVVQVNGVLSSPENVTCGVPQGSILGPLLFILYVNEMYSVVNCQLILYGDDSAKLLVSGKDVNEIETMLGKN